MAVNLDSDLLFRLSLNFFVAIILTRGLYYRIYKSDEFLFTFIIFNILIFFITYFLNKVNISLGAAFGLFAVFSMLRYRTEGISMKNMTYLFMVIALGMLNAIAESWVVLVILNSAVLGITALLEKGFFVKRETSKTLTYDVLANVRPDAKAALLSDIETRTGLPVHRIEIESIDLLRDVATLKVFYYS